MPRSGFSELLAEPVDRRAVCIADPVALVKTSAGTVTGLGGPAVEADHGDQVSLVALEDGDVVADERQRVVDLVGHAGDELAQAGELLRLDHPALRGLELLVCLVLRLRELPEGDVLLLELLLGPHPLGHVPEDALDTDGLAIAA
jgi:hypothetical protein